MKKFIIALIISTFLCSCSQTYYQIFTIKPSENTSTNELIYEDDIVKINYDFWDNKGKMAFTVYNKTDSIIYVDMSKSHLITNDLALDYFTNGSIGHTVSYGVYNQLGYATKWDNITQSSMFMNSNYKLNSIHKIKSVTHSVGESWSNTYVEKVIIAIPPKTYKIFNKYKLFDYYIPEGEKENITYTKKETPLNFRNYLVIRLNNESHFVDNSFYISEVSKPKESNDVKLHNNTVKRDKNNGKESNHIEKFYSNNKFYVMYIK